MNDLTFKIFLALSPFLAAFLTYYFAIKGKKVDVDIAKERELNTVLSNLLVVWHYLSRLEIVVKTINESEGDEGILPIELIPQLMLKSGFLNDKCFTQLDESVELLKKYDPIVYYQLEGTGRNLELLKRKFILPFLEQVNAPKGVINAGAGTILNETLDEVEGHLQDLAESIGDNVSVKVRTYISSHRKSEAKDISEELTRSYYEMILPIAQSQGQDFTFEEFMKEAKTEEFKRMIKFQLDIAMSGNINLLLEQVSKNPNISLEELEKLIQSPKP